MAVSLKGDDFGRLVDHFGGRADLERGVVRVLHSLSFIDDPTRIFRAIRYENRYGFRMDAHTLSLARACIEMGLVGELSSARMRDELVLLLSEREVGDAILRLAEIGLAASIHPHLAADAETVALIDRVDAIHERVAPGEERWRLRLAVLARRLPPEELFDWFRELKLRRRDAERIADAVALSPRLPAQLETVTEAAEAERLIAPHDPEGRSSRSRRRPRRPRPGSSGTSPSSARSSWRSRAAISPRSGSRSRPAWARCSASCCAAS